MKIRAATLRSFLAVHTWVGLIAGLFLFIAFYAGSLTIFHEQIAAWQRGAAASEAVPQRPVAPQAQQLIAALVHAYPQARERFILDLPSPTHAQLGARWYDDKTARWRSFRLDADDQLVAADKAPSNLSDFIYSLHYTAGIPGIFGLYLFGVVCILYGLALVSGVIIVLPTLAADLFALRQGRNLKRFWQDAHNAIGVLSLPFHIIFAWTGAILTIGTLLLAPFQYLIYDGQLLKIVMHDLSVSEDVSAAGIAATPASVATLLDNAQATAPGFVPTLAVFEHYGDARARVQFYGGNAQAALGHTVAIAADATSGAVMRVSAPNARTPGTAFYDQLRALHFADYGGLAVRWLYFGLGLLGAFLFYSGNLLWIESRRKRRQPLQPGNTRFLARLTLGVCLGCIAGISSMFVASKLLPADLAARESWERGMYFGVFFASIIWAQLRVPTRAACELLWLCAASSASLAVADLAINGGATWHAALRGHPAALTIDVLALLAAPLFVRAARACLRRGRNGDPHSVWALPEAAIVDIIVG